MRENLREDMHILHTLSSSGRVKGIWIIPNDYSAVTEAANQGKTPIDFGEGKESARASYTWPPSFSRKTIREGRKEPSLLERTDGQESIVQTGPDSSSKAEAVVKGKIPPCFPV